MRYRKLHNKTARAGLTLVEMLIALALSIFIMSILSEAFIKGLEAFGNYKALADLEQRLRTVANILRRDLRANHFDGNKKLSECTVSGKPMPMLDGLPAAAFTTALQQQQVTALLRQLGQYRFQTPSEGFFSIEEFPNRPGGTPRITAAFEGQDASNRPSYRDQYDVLHFTSRLEGNEPDKFFYGKTRQRTWNSAAAAPNPIPIDLAGQVLNATTANSARYDSATVAGTVFTGNGLYTSQAAELLYFMDTDDTANLPGVGTALGPVLTFNLYRQAWLLIPSRFSDGSTTETGDSAYTGNPALYPVENDVSAYNNGGNYFYNTMADVQHRERRVNPGIKRQPKLQAPGTPGSLREGSDIMLTNVISFDVKVYDPFAYKIPLGCTGGGPTSGRGAYVDIGDTCNVPGTYIPTAASQVGDALKPVFGGDLNNNAVIDYFDTGTLRYEGTPGGTQFTPAQSPATHAFPFTSIQITIRVYEPKSRQTRQITIIQDM